MGSGHVKKVNIFSHYYIKAQNNKSESHLDNMGSLPNTERGLYKKIDEQKNYLHQRMV